MKIIINGEIAEVPVGGSDSSSSSLPIGGTAGQVLTKTSDEDYDVEWTDASSDIELNFATSEMITQIVEGTYGE